jgi:hypothetical protein
MKKMIRKATTWLMIVCLILSFVPVFGAAYAAEEQPDAVVLTAQESEDEESGSGDPLNFFKSIGAGLQAISVNDVLTVPANVIDDLLTYCFTILKLLGFNVDTMYTKIASLFSLQRPFGAKSAFTAG